MVTLLMEVILGFSIQEEGPSASNIFRTASASRAAKQSEKTTWYWLRGEVLPG